MKTLLLHKHDIPLAAWLIKQGKLVAFPTETVYGLGANALDPKAVKSIFAAKGRPADNPLIVHIADIKQVPGLVKKVSPQAVRLMQCFWPGPVSIVFEKSSSVPQETTAGLSTVVLRMPSHPLARQFIAAAGVPIAAPSANRSGRPSPTSAKHVLDDLSGRIAAVLDGGKAQKGLESTVIDVRKSPAVILRLGSIPLEELEHVLGEVELASSVKKTLSPGMKYRHYAPKAKLILVEGQAAQVDARIRELKKQYKTARVARRSELAAHNLFSFLRSADKGVMLVPSVPERGLGRAVMDRLRRAASRKIVV